MKKFLFLFMVLFSAVLLAQTPNWTSVKETNINVGSAISVDIFTNRDGNHIIVQESNNLKYYKMNLNGVAGSPITIENSSVVSPSISGNDDYIFIVYGIGSQIRVRRSTNGGTNWTLWTSFSIATSASWMESVVSNQKLHVTYLESSIVKYRFRDQDGSTWSDIKTVSTGETGTNPRITARYAGSNNDNVYFLWQKSSTNQYNWRKYEVTQNSWTSVLFGYSVSVPNLHFSNPAGFRITGSTMIIYYSYAADDEFGQFQYFFNWAWKNINNNNLLGTAYPNYGNLTNRVYVTTTFDNVSHTAFYYAMIAGEGGEQPDIAIWRSSSTTGYWDDFIYEYQDPGNQPIFINVSSAGNEVHAIWKDDFGSNNGNNLRYKFDNQPPIVPQNLTISAYNDHPKLTWNRNPDSDIDFYRIYKSKGGSPFQAFATAPDYLQEYVDNNETICDPPPGQECINEEIATYKITAVDKTSPNALESDYSNEVKTSIIGPPPHKSIPDDFPGLVYEYKLYQNYPNPFNPATSINYQVKDRGFVSLKVYDMLGREVAALVNETQDQGEYSVGFDASDLPSGVYIYSLRVNDFVQNKKMTFIK